MDLNLLNMICAVVDDNPTGTTSAPRSDLLPIGTRVRSIMEGRATGRIVGYNENSPNAFYSSTLYPYVMEWADGYRDYYGLEEGIIWVDPDFVGQNN